MLRDAHRIVYRRRAHLVTLGADMALTVSPFDGLYWSPVESRTFVCLRRCEGDGLWLPLESLIGHWDWFAGSIVRVRVLDGYGPCGPVGPKYDVILKGVDVDEDTGASYWHSYATGFFGSLPRPMAHT